MDVAEIREWYYNIFIQSKSDDKERKVLQITGDTELWALCDDGNIYQLKGGLWYKVPKVPGSSN
jgi:hypothetical protein